MRKIRFISVDYQNFKGTTDRKSFEFNDSGLYLLTGRNGAGKSTIFDAIACCLFRRIKTSDGNIRISDLVNDRIGKNLEIKVELEVEEGNKTDKYEIFTFYNHKDNGNKTIIYVNGKEINFKKIDENVSFIESNIISFDLYYNIINFPQQSKDTFASATDSEKKALFDLILDFDFYNNLRDRVKEEINNVEGNIDKYLLEIDFIEKKIDELNNNKQIEQLNSEDKKINLSKKLDELKEKLSTYNNQNLLDELQLVEQKYIDYTNRSKVFSSKKNELELKVKDVLQKISDVNSKLENTINKLEMEKDKQIIQIKNQEAQDINELTNQLNNKENELDKLKNKLELELSQFASKLKEEYGQLISDKEKELTQVDYQLNEQIQLIKSQTDNEIGSLQVNLGKLEVEESNILNKISELENTLNNIGNGGICPFCKQNIDEKHIPRIQEEITILNNKLIEIKSEKTKIENQIELIQKELNGKIQQLEKEYNDKKIVIQTEIDNLKNDANSLYLNKKNEVDQEIKNLDDTLQSEKDEFNRQVDIIKNKYLETINNITNQFEEDILIVQKEGQNAIANLQKEKEILIDQIDLVNSDYEKVEEEIIKINQTIKKIRDDVDTMKEIEYEIKTTEESINTVDVELKERLERLDSQISDNQNRLIEINKSIENDKERLEILKFWYDKLGPSGIKNYLINSVIPTINEYMNEIIGKFQKFRIKLLPAKETKSGDLVNKIDIEITNIESGANSYSKLSGGERRLIDFAFLLSLNKLYSQINGIKINILLLDELFDSLDYDNSVATLEMLKKESMNKSIYIISHSDIWKSNDLFDIVFEV